MINSRIVLRHYSSWYNHLFRKYELCYLCRKYGFFPFSCHWQIVVLCEHLVSIGTCFWAEMVVPSKKGKPRTCPFCERFLHGKTIDDFFLSSNAQLS